MELISIIVPLYNKKALIQRCIDSLLQQSYKKIEVIIVDDGSTDGSGYLCDTVYGEIDNANIENLENAPPDIKLINPAIPSVVVDLLNTAISIPGTVM